MLRIRVSLGLVLFAALATSACDPDGSKPPTETETEPTVEDEFIAKVRELEAAGYVVEDILAWAQTTRGKNAYTSIQNRADWPKFWPVADAMFAKALEARSTPEEQVMLYRAQFKIHAEAGEDGSAILRQALAIKPDLGLWHDARKTNETIAATSTEVWLELCIALRPLIDSDPEFNVEDFYFVCESRADQDLTRLWPDAAKDYADRAMLAERLSSFHSDLATLVPGGGKCKPEPGYCNTIGWISRKNREVESECIGEDCSHVGWVSNTPDGVVNTRCNDKNCLQSGWKSKGDSQSWTATCTKGDCYGTGFTLKGKKQRYTFTCRAESCFANGYEVVSSQGWKFICYCDNGNCPERGTFCKNLP